MKIERTIRIKIPEKIEMTEVFIANDGTKFYSLLECLDHENKLKLLEAKKLIKNIYNIELSDLSLLSDCISAIAYWINNEEEYNIIYNYAISKNLQYHDKFIFPGWYIISSCDGRDYRDYTEIISLKSITDEQIIFLEQFTKTVI